MAEKVGAVLVLGAGVGGIAAALDLAESGFRVYLVDSCPSIGGTLSRVDRWFPDNRCQMCQMLPVFSGGECSQFCLRRDLAHPNVELIPDAEIEGVTGEAGNFEVSLKMKSRWVHPEKCTGCGCCVAVCPIEVPDEFNEDLRRRKAIYLRNPRAVPNGYTIDRDNCNQCGRCVAVCPTGAIDLGRPDEFRKVAAGAIIVASGAGVFDPVALGQYGFGRYANVLTSIQLERMLDPSGPWGGRLLCPADGKAPQKIAFLQCIGSRDVKRDYCSAVCCMSALKEAMLIKQQRPKAEVHVFHMDLRAYGKGHYRYYLKARDSGISFTACRVPVVRENPKTRNLLVLAQAEDGSPITSEFDLVVLSVGQCPSSHTAELSQVLGVGVNKWGFLGTQDFGQVKTAREGVYVCGSAVVPADISEAVVQASAAAGEASILLSAARNQLVAQQVEPGGLDSSDEPAKVAIIVCRCGEEIASVVDTGQVVALAQTLPGVVHVEDVSYLCLPDSLNKIKQAIVQSGANRVILAACAPYHYQRLFAEAMREVGLDSPGWQLVNFREQIAWVHRDSQTLATEKAWRLLAIAVEQLRGQELLSIPSAPVNHQGLVIGGGISGLVAAQCLAEEGFEVCLVERSAELGGHARDLHYGLGNEDPQAFLSSLCQRIKANPRIRLYLGAEVIATTGYAGSFHTRVKTEDGTITSIEHGATIIATGAKDYQPTEYRYGQDDRIITQKELQRRLARGMLGQASTVVMLQCVGSRDNAHPYCSRTCCSEAIASSLRIKEQSPQTQVFILYRDLMTYGFKEEYYTRAREAGILFIRYELDRKPEVSLGDKAILVEIDEPTLRGKLEIEADLLVLSTGIVPAANQGLAAIFSLELTEDGFFKEVSKFRPVDSVIDGIFICGRANAPMSLEEEVVQAQAAAQRAATILAKERLKPGRLVAEVNERRCSGCGLCVTACPYAAREIDEERKVARVREILCRGCGACLALCPNGAAKTRGVKERQIFSVLEAALGAGQKVKGGS